MGFRASDDIRAELDDDATAYAAEYARAKAWIRPSENNQSADRTETDDQKSARRERRRILDQMAAEAEEAGLYDLTGTPKRTR